MGQSLPPPGLRPFLPTDTPILAEILRSSVLELTGEDYNEAQQEAWVSVVEDLEAFATRLSEQLTLVATLQGAPIGFASLKGADQIDLLYVHPHATRAGAATLLCDALEKLATARGATQIKTDASETAAEFFQKRGYIPMQRNSVSMDGEWLANTTMKKALAEAAPGAAT